MSVPCRPAEHRGLLSARVRGPHPTLVQFGPAAPLSLGTPPPCRAAPVTASPGCPRGQGGFAPFLSPSEAWVTLGPSSPKAGVREHQSRQGTGEPGAAGGHRAGRPLRAVGMLHTPSSSSSRAELGCTWAAPRIAVGTSCLALSGRGLSHPTPPRSQLHLASVPCGHVKPGAPASARPFL